jgi:mono/diheme cytochrome c family protein
VRRAAALAAAAALGAVLAGAAQAQDADRGRLLYDTHCQGCHYERIHRRSPERSLVKSLAALRLEVARRAALVPQRFSPDELDDIAEYLNRSHYRFER